MRKAVLATFILTFSGVFAEARQPSEEPAAVLAPLFRQTQPLAVTLSTDLGELLKDRDDDSDYREARFTFPDDTGREVTQDIKVKTRGNFRLKRRNCDFPPLRINLKKGQVEGTPFAGQDKLKLVTHCQDRSLYEQYVLEEYLIYKAYNLLTPKSFNVRLVRITYVDVKDPEDRFEKFGFLIEDNEAMARRNGAKLMEMKGIPHRVTSPEETITLSLFQYLMGNTDWSIPALHNVELIQPNDRSILIPVPFDFDFAGVISTRYSTPAPHLGIGSVEERLYRGECRSATELQPAIDHFNEIKDSLYALYEDMSDLDDRRRKRALRYFDDFYKTINSRHGVEAEFIDSCRG